MNRTPMNDTELDLLTAWETARERLSDAEEAEQAAHRAYSKYVREHPEERT